MAANSLAFPVFGQERWPLAPPSSLSQIISPLFSLLTLCPPPFSFHRLFLSFLGLPHFLCLLFLLFLHLTLLLSLDFVFFAFVFSLLSSPPSPFPSPAASLLPLPLRSLALMDFLWTGSEEFQS